jgi:hypothetical protein
LFAGEQAGVFKSAGELELGVGLRGDLALEVFGGLALGEGALGVGGEDVRERLVHLSCRHGCVWMPCHVIAKHRNHIHRLIHGASPPAPAAPVEWRAGGRVGHW